MTYAQFHYFLLMFAIIPSIGLLLGFLLLLSQSSKYQTIYVKIAKNNDIK